MKESPKPTNFVLFGGHWLQPNTSNGTMLTMATAKRLVKEGIAKWTAFDQFKKGKHPISMVLLKPMSKRMLSA
jgi:hypothetical protein